MALLALLSHSPTGAHAAGPSMSPSFLESYQQCLQCFDTVLPSCGKWRPAIAMEYATCLCGADAFSNTKALLPCAKICLENDALDPMTVVFEYIHGYCSTTLPATWCKDDPSEFSATSGFWDFICPVENGGPPNVVEL